MIELDPRDPYGLRGKMQLCLRCGRHEVAGSFCSFCRTADYVLADHSDVFHGGCPLGPHLDPLPSGHPAKPEEVRAFLAIRSSALPDDVPVRYRHHPRAVGYSAADDPEAPAWVRATGHEIVCTSTQPPAVGDWRVAAFRLTPDAQSAAA
jgi:hypothetical protein